MGGAEAWQLVTTIDATVLLRELQRCLSVPVSPAGAQ
jgi:hypothetical protein